MEAQAARSSNPLVIIAAVAITLFSLVGIGAVLGWIPTSIGTQNNAVPAPLAQAPAQPVVQPEPVKQVEQKPAPRPKPVVKREAPAPRAAYLPGAYHPVRVVCASAGAVDDDLATACVLAALRDVGLPENGQRLVHKVPAARRVL